MKYSSTILFISILSAIVVLYFFLFQKPVNQDIAGLKSKIMQGHGRESEDKILSHNLEEMTATVEELRGEILELKEGLLEPDKYSLLMTDLGKLFGNHGLVNLSTSLKKPILRQGYEATSIDMRIEGDFENLYRFLQDLEDLPYGVWIDALDIMGSAEGGGKLAVAMTVSAPLDPLRKDSGT